MVLVRYSRLMQLLCTPIFCYLYSLDYVVYISKPIDLLSLRAYLQAGAARQSFYYKFDVLIVEIAAVVPLL